MELVIVALVAGPSSVVLVAGCLLALTRSRRLSRPTVGARQRRETT